MSTGVQESWVQNSDDTADGKHEPSQGSNENPYEPSFYSLSSIGVFDALFCFFF